MLEDGAEFPCRADNVSAVGIAVRGLRAGAIGEWVVAYLHELGRVEGVVVRRTAAWFAFDIRASSRKRERLAHRIKWLARREDETSSAENAALLAPDDSASA